VRGWQVVCGHPAVLDGAVGSLVFHAWLLAWFARQGRKAVLLVMASLVAVFGLSFGAIFAQAWGVVGVESAFQNDPPKSAAEQKFVPCEGL
jgi:hypothetical protein